MTDSLRATTRSDRNLLTGRGYRADVVETILGEGLLPGGLARRLRTLYPRHSAGLTDPHPPLFAGKERYEGIEGYRQVVAALAEHGIDIGHHEERELFVDVYRFLVTRHILNRIDWRRFVADPMFQLVFPQPGMIRGDVVEAYRRAGSREERVRIAADHTRKTNPHDGKQLLNKPWFIDSEGRFEVLEGCQHKYPQVQLIFDRATQHCFSFCTYCFRHAQVRGDEDMFLQEDVDQVHEYLRRHREVGDLLITGGDAGFLSVPRFLEYVTPLLEDPSLVHVKTVRLGSRALTYAPDLVLRPGYDRMLEVFDRLYEEGIQVAWMAHFSTPREVLDPLTLAAIRRLQAHHVVIRSQSPIMRHVSMFCDAEGEVDVDRTARSWIDLGNLLGMLNVGFHSIYCARPTGEHEYFSAPLAVVQRIYDEIYRSLPSINRPGRHLSMTTSAGKISILGTAWLHGEKVFALKFSEGRDMEWLDPVFLAKYDEHTRDVSLLEPWDGDAFFFEDGLAEIEAGLEEALAAREGA